MKNCISTIRSLFRKDNIKTWLPMVGTFAGTLFSPVYAIYVEKNLALFIFSMISFAICALLYLFFVFRYIQQMHSIHDVLRSDKSMWRTCAYLACLTGNTQVNHYKLQKLNIDYRLETPSRTSTGVIAYPFSVEYDIYGLATHSFSVVYFHTLGSVHKDKHISVEYAFDNIPYISADESNYCGSKNAVTFYQFINDTSYQKGDPVHYRIKITFGIERGIAVDEIQRLLFNPSNFTTNCKGIIAQIKLFCPKTFDQHFNTLHLNQYINGFNQVPNSNQLRFAVTSVNRNVNMYRCRIKLDADQLFALSFIAKKQDKEKSSASR